MSHRGQLRSHCVCTLLILLIPRLQGIEASENSNSNSTTDGSTASTETNLTNVVDLADSTNSPISVLELQNESNLKNGNATNITMVEVENATNGTNMTLSANMTDSVLGHNLTNLSNETDIWTTSAPDIASVVSQLQSDIAELRRQIQAERQTGADLKADLGARLDAGESRMDGLNRSIDTGWLAYNTTLIFLMQLGFALVEAGSVRKKSYRHVFLKNLLDCSVSIALWLMIGYWIAFPGKWDNVMDLQKFDLFFIAEEGTFFAFQAVFASTCITIVSGAMAERTRMEAYLAFCGICGGLVYPVIVRWTWGGGWMAEFEPPYHDFAGSGVVHATGGAAAFVGAWLVGPRAGRWESEASLRDDDKYKPHSLDNVVMGTFLLWFGWFGFNPGSTTSLVDDSADVAAVAFVNTMVSPVFSAITVMAVGVLRHAWHRGAEEDRPPPFDLGKICNGVLGGLVGITAGCDAIPVEWTIVVGIMSGLAMLSWMTFTEKMRIDDPVDASAVHGCCGMLGVLAVGLFHRESGLCTTGDSDLLVTQMKGIGAIVGYVACTAFVYFYVVHAFGYLRLDMLIEVLGIDRVDFSLSEITSDITALEIQAVNRYRAQLLDRFEGHLWGISVEQGVIYAKMYRRMTTLLLVLAMSYNYLYYTYFEWRGWNFFSVMNCAVGCQCAAASHAEFLVKAGDPRLRYYCVVIVVIGLGLAVSNFVITPHGDLLIAWLRTLSLSFSWSLWMHFRVHPMNWDHVCGAKARQSLQQGKTDRKATFLSQISESEVGIMARSMFEMGSPSHCTGYLLNLFLVGRFQHIGESTMAYASVTSDLWVGLDELRNYIDGEEGSSLWLGVALIFFSVLQSTGTLSRLVVPTRKRSIIFFQSILVLTTVSEAPIVVLVFLNSESSLKWVSIFFSTGSISFQMFNLMVAVCRKRKEARDAKLRPNVQDIPAPSLQQAALPPAPPAPAAPAPESKPETEPEASIVEEFLNHDEESPVDMTRKSEPSHASQVCWTRSPSPSPLRSPLHTARSFKTPRLWQGMTTPRDGVSARSLLVTPQFSSRRHSPMNTPRGFSPRL